MGIELSPFGTFTPLVLVKVICIMEYITFTRGDGDAERKADDGRRLADEASSGNGEFSEGRREASRRHSSGLVLWVRLEDR
jgi:hypothetical protein